MRIRSPSMSITFSGCDSPMKKWNIYFLMAVLLVGSACEKDPSGVESTSGENALSNAPAPSEPITEPAPTPDPTPAVVPRLPSPIVRRPRERENRREERRRDRDDD